MTKWQKITSPPPINTPIYLGCKTPTGDIVYATTYYTYSDGEVAGWPYRLDCLPTHWCHRAAPGEIPEDL